MIQLTDSAVAAVKTALSRAKEPAEGLRIMVQTGGCAGYKYSMGLVRDPAPTDFVVEHGDVRVYVDAESEPHIKGTTVDFVVGLETSGFTFTNPNATSKCSCGKSFG